MADIKVTQDDREAAAKCHERSCYEIIRIQAVQCRNGYADGDYLVQTFARHRIEAELRGAKKMRDAAAAEAEKLAAEFPNLSIDNPMPTGAAVAAGYLGRVILALDPAAIVGGPSNG